MGNIQHSRHSAVAIAAVALTISSHALAGTPVVYGEDNRKDLYEVRNPQLLKLADSTVALMRGKSLIKNTSGSFDVSSLTLQKSLNVCAQEKFSQQPNGAYCSGFLVAKNIVVTAGHCVTDAAECADLKMVFGYSVKSAGQYPKAVPAQEVYGCKRIIHRELTGNASDFAVLELDRSVTGHDPLVLSKRAKGDSIENGTSLVLIGNPVGVPTKIAEGGVVRNGSFPNFFRATTDSYHGNSGSAVFNAHTGEVEGILVRGENDFELTAQGCYVTKVCANDACRGEDATNISEVMPYLKMAIR